MQIDNLNGGKNTQRVTVTAEDLEALKAGSANANANADVAPNGNDGGDRGDGPKRPEWLPEKFWDAEKGEANYEALARSYAEAERLASQRARQPAEGGGKQGDGKEGTGNEPAQLSPEQLQEKATKELIETGSVSQETYDAYAKLGVSRQMIDSYIEAQRAVSGQRTQAAFTEVGGEENYKAMIEWARDALTPEEIAAYDRAVNGEDNAAMLIAVRGLSARYKAEAGAEGRILNGKANRNGGGDLFESKAQLVEAMRDPRYAKDEGYRKQIAEKMARSLAAGRNLGV